MELLGQALVKVLRSWTFWFTGVVEAFLKVGLYNSSPRSCNRVRPDTILLRIVLVTDPVSIHLNDLDSWEIIVLQAAFDLEVGAE